MEFYDTNGDGIPDAFEDREPISVILNREPTPAETHGTIVLEIEKRKRAPQKGEYFFCGSDKIERANSNYPSDLTFMIIKRIVAGTIDGYGEKQIAK